MNNRSGLFLAVGLGLIGLGGPSTYAASRAATPFQLAVQQAALAAKADTVTAIRKHLQQTLNCLEGGKSQDFKDRSGNPCSWKGAVDALPKDSADLIRARKSIALARVGESLHDRDPAHYVAEAVHAILVESQHRELPETSSASPERQTKQGTLTSAGLS